MPAVTRHQPGREQRVRDGEPQARAVCTCGALTGWMYGGKGARAVTAAVRAHERELAAGLPEDQRCRDPQTHRTPAWEPCPVCAHQEALF